MYGPDEPEQTDTEARVFTVANPPGSVAVSALMDGRISEIDLGPKAGELSEADLAEEIVVVAGLAARDAKSAQHAAMLDGMREQGHDDAATRDFLARDLGLPTPDEAHAERARVFATRYGGAGD
nr:YbaB/EbfC family DNA-binding protein [Mycobacterium sp. E740]